MKYSILKKNLLRLYNSYVKKHLYKLILALILSFAVAGGTAAIAWLLDPAVKKIFMEQDKEMMLLIPIAIVMAFFIKGSTLYILLECCNNIHLENISSNFIFIFNFCNSFLHVLRILVII